MFEPLIIIIIAIGVGILSSIFRNKAEEERPGLPRRPPQGSGRSRPSMENVDRFLEEIERRRREAAQHSRTPASAPPVRTRTAPQRTEPPRRPVAAPAPVKPARPSRLPSARPSSPPVEVVVVEETGRVEKITSSVPPADGRTPEARPVVPGIEALSSVSSPAKIAEQAASPVLASLLPLLRSPRTLATAVVLQEIVGKPRCQRPRGR